MEVNDSMINKLASLARLRFDDEERESVKNDLQKMISFVQKMDEVNTGDIEPLQHITGEKNVWREDEIKGSCSQEQALENAAHHNNQFFMVPKIIQKH